MDLLDTIIGASSGNEVLQHLAHRSQISPEQAGHAMSRIIPALNEGMRKNLSREGGMEALTGALSSGHHQQYLNRPETLEDEATVSDGHKILGHLLGSKDGSREVAMKVAGDTGVDAGAIKKLLPLVAAVAMGALSKQAQSGGLTQILSSAIPNLEDAGSSLGALNGLLSGNEDPPAEKSISGLAKNFLK